jgi:SAM-dependent methyltransferase
MPGLATRHRIPELMDDPAVDPAAHRRALAGLARINRLSRSPAILWPPLRELAKAGPLRVLDVATGGGDVPIALRRKAVAAGLRIEFAACDVSETALAAARENAARAGVPEIEFFRHDVLRDPLPGGFDAVTCSLFLHHLSDEEAVTALGRMKDAAARAVLVNDLARSRLGFALAWAGVRLLSRSPIVRFDGPASVRSAYTPAEAVAVAERAGLTGATAARRWPCRFLLRWSRA